MAEVASQRGRQLRQRLPWGLELIEPCQEQLVQGGGMVDRRLPGEDPPGVAGSSTIRVISSMKRGMPSVLATICSTVLSGRGLP